MKKPILVVMVGYPGSGKTYFSEKLAKNKSFAHLNSDKIRSELFESPTFTKKEHKVVFSMIDELVEGFLKENRSVIVDANSPRRSQRKAFMKLASRCDADCMSVYMVTPFSLTRERVRARKDIRSKEKRTYNRFVTPKVHAYLKDLLEQPQSPESFVMIDGRKSFREQYFEFERAIEKIK